MSNNITLEILSDYFFNYTKRYQPDTERYEIDEFLSEWLVRIQAPSDARGIMIVLRNIGEYAQDAEVKNHFQKVFYFPDWFFPALQYAHKIDNKIISNAVDNQHMAAG